MSLSEKIRGCAAAYPPYFLNLNKPKVSGMSVLSAHFQLVDALRLSTTGRQIVYHVNSIRNPFRRCSAAQHFPMILCTNL